MNIFISHIAEEATIANTLKDWIESTFPDRCKVFVSSNSEDISPGDRWFEKINTALETATTLFVICSPLSTKQPWINFEAGCGWIKKVPVIPLCYSGLKKGALPPPLGMLQALEIDDQKFTRELISLVSKNLNCSSTPRIDYNSFNAEIVKSIQKIKYRESQITPDNSINTKQLTEDEIKVLQIFGKRNDMGLDRTTVSDVSQNMGISISKTKYIFDCLANKNYIDIIMVIDGGEARYYLTNDGLAFLVENQLI